MKWSRKRSEDLQNHENRKVGISTVPKKDWDNDSAVLPRIHELSHNHSPCTSSPTWDLLESGGMPWRTQRRAPWASGKSRSGHNSQQTIIGCIHMISPCLMVNARYIPGTNFKRAKKIDPNINPCRACIWLNLPLNDFQMNRRIQWLLLILTASATATCLAWGKVALFKWLWVKVGQWPTSQRQARRLVRWDPTRGSGIQSSRSSPRDWNCRSRWIMLDLGAIWMAQHEQKLSESKMNLSKWHSGSSGIGNMSRWFLLGMPFFRERSSAGLNGCGQFCRICSLMSRFEPPLWHCQGLGFGAFLDINV